MQSNRSSLIFDAQQIRYLRAYSLEFADTRRILGSNDWTALENRLLAFVRNYSYKVVPARNGFQF